LDWLVSIVQSDVAIYPTSQKGKHVETVQRLQEAVEINFSSLDNTEERPEGFSAVSDP